MRKLIFIFGIFICTGLQAQTQLFVVGGIDKTEPFVSSNRNTTKLTGGFTNWQLGVSAQLPIEKMGFLYSGLFYETKRTDKEYLECCFFYDKGIYRPAYLTMPFGGGVQLPLGKSIQLKFSGGAYISLGVGGNAKGTGGGGDIGPVIYHDYNRKINFGEAIGNDFERWNWGFQLGSAIAWKKLELRFAYNHGISNIIPSNPLNTYSYLIAKYRSTQLNLAYRLVTFKK